MFGHDPKRADRVICGFRPRLVAFVRKDAAVQGTVANLVATTGVTVDPTQGEAMLHVLFLVLTAAASSSQAVANDPVTHLFSSKPLSEERSVSVYLPAGYHASQESYPVLYILDGRNRTHDTLTITRYLAERRQAPPLIVVSIPHTGERRRDYLPFDATSGAANPGVAAFGSFLADELVPWVDGHFRTKPHRLLLGHSLGGLFVLHSLIAYPDLFRSRLALSPSLHHNPKLVNALAEALDGKKTWNSRIYLNIGGMEFAPIRTQFARLQRVFAEHAPAGLAATFQTFPHDGHSTTPFVGVYSALKAQYVLLRPSLEQMKQILDEQTLPAYYQQLSSAFGYAVTPDYRDLADHWSFFYFQQEDAATAAKLAAAMKHYYPDRIDSGDAAFVAHWDRHGMTTAYPDDAAKPREAFVNRFGYAFLERGRVAEAVFVLETNTRLYPQSANAFDSLGEAYQKAGRNRAALTAFQRAVALAERAGDENLALFRSRCQRLSRQLAETPR